MAAEVHQEAAVVGMAHLAAATTAAAAEEEATMEEEEAAMGDRGSVDEVSRCCSSRASGEAALRARRSTLPVAAHACAPC